MKACQCGKAFKLNGSLYNHIKNKHEGNYLQFKVSTTKRGRPKKPVTISEANTKNKEFQYNLSLNQDGNSIVPLFDTGLFASQTFRKLMNDFSSNHSNLINENQISSCNYLRASSFFHQSTNETRKFYVEIVGFVQMLIPNMQQKILDYCLDELQQTKQPLYDIANNLQKDLTTLITTIYQPFPSNQSQPQDNPSSSSSSANSPQNLVSTLQKIPSQEFKIEYEQSI